jgi:hypothetical protein
MPQQPPRLSRRSRRPPNRPFSPRPRSKSQRIRCSMMSIWNFIAKESTRKPLPVSKTSSKSIQNQIGRQCRFLDRRVSHGLKAVRTGHLAFQKVIKKYPNGNKVPNALLRQALAFYELNDKTSAKLLLRKAHQAIPQKQRSQNCQEQTEDHEMKRRFGLQIE